MIVAKFGGTSVGAVEQIERAARIVQSMQEKRPVVILSAMAKVTDGLLSAGEAALAGKPRERDDILWEIRSKHDHVIQELFKDRKSAAAVQETLRLVWEEMQKIFTGVSLLRELSDRSRDLIGSFGERLIVPVFAAYLRELGMTAEAIDARELIITSEESEFMLVDFVETRKRCQKLVRMVKSGTLPVVTGFICSTPEGITTTLGRGGFMLNRLRSFLNIKKGEERPTLLLFTYVTLVFTAYIIAKSVRDALFLDQFAASSLPFLYIGVAIVIALIVAIYIRLSFRFAQAALVSVTLLFFMLTALFLWGAIRFEWASTAVVYYIWVNILGVIVTAQAWTLAASVLNVTQARRLFPLLCTGGVVGSMLGGSIAALIVDLTGTDNLILATPALLGLSVPIVWTLVRLCSNRRPALEEQSPEIEENSSVGSVLKITMRTRYLRLIATLLAVSAVVTLFTDFQFKMLIQDYFQSKDAMTAFFGSFYAYVGLLSLAAQLVAGTRLFAKYGVHLALLFLPTALLGGTAALVAFPTLLWTGVFLKGSEGVIRSSIDKSTIEMLYVPVPQTLKIQVKAVIDMLIQRFSDAVGGVLLIILTQMMGLSLIGVGICNIALLCWWIWIAHKTRQEYVSATRQPPPTPNIDARAA